MECKGKIGDLKLDADDRFNRDIVECKGFYPCNAIQSLLVLIET